jgi:hypothetical protein
VDVSGSTGTSRSSRTWSGSRLVANTFTFGVPATIASTSRPTSSSTCSQLSSTSSMFRSRSDSAINCSIVVAVFDWPSAACTVVSTAVASVIDESRTIQRPSGALPNRRATSIASDVFPTPPGPTSETTRVVAKAARTVVMSVARPTISVVPRGRLPIFAWRAGEGGCATSTPSALTENTSTGSAMSFRLTAPSGTSSIPSVSAPEVWSVTWREMRIWWASATDIRRAARFTGGPK